MKKVLILSALVVSITSSLVAGTLATYTKTTAPVEASIKAKNFNLITNATVDPDIKLAPGEATEWTFTVENFENNIVTETDMDLYINVLAEATTGKDSINGLSIELYEGSSPIGNTITKNGNIEIKLDKAFKANKKAVRTFTLKVNWVNGLAGDEADTNDAINENSTKIKVDVTATQSNKSIESKTISYLDENGSTVELIGFTKNNDQRVYVNKNGKQLFRTNGEGDNGNFYDMFTIDNEPYIIVENYKKGITILGNKQTPNNTIGTVWYGNYYTENQSIIEKTVNNGIGNIVSLYSAEQVGQDVLIKNNGVTEYEIKDASVSGGLRGLIVINNQPYVIVKHRTKGLLVIGSNEGSVEVYSKLSMN